MSPDTGRALAVTEILRDGRDPRDDISVLVTLDHTVAALFVEERFSIYASKQQLKKDQS